MSEIEQKWIKSKLWLPKNPTELENRPSPFTILDFLSLKFDKIPRETWLERLNSGKVTYCHNELALTHDMPYQGGFHIQYFREIANEVPLPVQEKILFENERILVVDKPHFLPVHPSGKFVKESLIYRLRSAQNNPNIVPAHRLDRLTAGVMLLIKKEEHRAHYHSLFEHRKVQKTYLAIGKTPAASQESWHIKNRIVKAEPWFRLKIGLGEANSESTIKLLEQRDGLSKFELRPVTGKQHQLRLHLSCIGSGILNDPWYPELIEHAEDNFDKPMQLLAHELSFTDPYSGEELHFTSQIKLLF